MYTYLTQKTLFLFILFFTLASSVCTFFFIYNYWRLSSTYRAQSQQEARTRMRQASQHIKSFMQELKHVTTTLAQELYNNYESTDAIRRYLHTKPLSVSGLGIALVASEAESTPFAWYYVEYQDKQHEHLLNNQKDHYQEQSWYLSALQGESTFHGPLLDPITHEPTIIFSTPLYTQEKSKKIKGVIFASQSIAHLQHILSTLYSNQSTYWFITAQDGTFLMHPTKLLVTDKKNIQTSMPEALSLFNQLLSSHVALTEQTIPYTHPMTHKAAWLTGTYIGEGNFLLFSIFDMHNIFTYNDIIRKKLIHIVIALVASALGCIALYAFFLLHKPSLLWLCSAAASSILTIGIGCLWAITTLYPDYQETALPVKSKIELYQFLDSLPSSSSSLSDTLTADYYLHYRYKKKRYVPTGILIQDINFISKDQIEFVGIIWQRYFAGIHDHISRGFILQLLTSKPDIKEISKTVVGNRETYVWLVHAKLNQSINYYQFPFDVKDIKIQIAHKDFDKNIILVPDLDAYALLNPSLLPGINSHAHLSGWQLKASYFAYDIVHYNTSFGMYTYGPFGTSDQIDKSQDPELQFIVEAKRNLFDTLTTDLIALIVIALLLFLLLLTYKRQDFSNILTTFATILFSTIIAQQYFKSKIPSDEFVYFEFFHFIMYIAILLVMILTILDIFQCNVRFIRYKNNFVAALLYWPGILSALMIITWAYLY